MRENLKAEIGGGGSVDLVIDLPKFGELSDEDIAFVRGLYKYVAEYIDLGPIPRPEKAKTDPPPRRQTPTPTPNGQTRPRTNWPEAFAALVADPDQERHYKFVTIAVAKQQAKKLTDKYPGLSARSEAHGTGAVLHVRAGTYRT